MEPQHPLASSNDSVFDQLRQTGEKLPAELRARIVSLGTAAVPTLISLLEDEDAAAEDAPGEGWPPIHAVDLLAELQAEEAIGPMLAVLRSGDIDDMLSTRVAVRLPVFGARALEPVLAELSSACSTNHEVALRGVLACLGVRDERIWQALETYFGKDPTSCAGMLATYGDERALPLLARNILEFDDETLTPAKRFDLECLVEAYEEMAGELPDQLLEHVDYLLDLSADDTSDTDDTTDAPPQPAVSIKVGRNDPCPCGSGKKHKRCCLA